MSSSTDAENGPFDAVPQLAESGRNRCTEDIVERSSVIFVIKRYAVVPHS
jgi:hypothetical protein